MLGSHPFDGLPGGLENTLFFMVLTTQLSSRQAEASPLLPSLMGATSTSTCIIHFPDLAVDRWTPLAYKLDVRNKTKWMYESERWNDHRVLTWTGWWPSNVDKPLPSRTPSHNKHCKSRIRFEKFHSRTRCRKNWLWKEKPDTLRSGVWLITLGMRKKNTQKQKCDERHTQVLHSLHTEGGFETETSGGSESCRFLVEESYEP